jgi:hypothetical protein
MAKKVSKTPVPGPGARPPDHRHKPRRAAGGRLLKGGRWLLVTGDNMEDLLDQAGIARLIEDLENQEPTW